jgi:hypothetical protein
VYAVPFVKPVTVMGLLLPVAVIFSGLDTTVYNVIALPPLLTGGVKVIVAVAFPGTALTPVGAFGALGQFPACLSCVAEVALYIPLAEVVVVDGSIAEIIPPK